MLIRPKGYCPACNERRAYSLHPIIKETSFNGIIFNYEDIEAHCKKCGGQIKVPALDDRNWYERHKAYYKQVHETFREDQNEH